MTISTDQQVRSLLKAGKATKKAVGDGVYFRVSNEGTGFWIFKYTFNSKRCELSFGKYPEMSLREAREKGLAFRKQLANQINPLIEKAREKTNPFKTVNDLAIHWLDELSRRIKHPEIPERVYLKDIKPVIGQVTLKDLRATDVKRVIDKISTGENPRPTIANDALGYMKQIFNHGVKLDVMLGNPAAAFKPSDAGGTESSRERTLSLKEIESLFSAMERHKCQFGVSNMLSVKLLLLTGVRKNELLQAKWVEVDLENRCWTLPKERTKTNKEFKIPLANEAVECFNHLKGLAFDSDYVFPARRAGKRFSHVSPDTLNRALSGLLKKSDVPIPHFTVHDLRRTYRSLLAQLGVLPHIAERCLNHKLKGVEGVYDTYDYFDERIEANIQLNTLITAYI